MWGMAGELTRVKAGAYNLQENRTGEECFGHGLTIGEQTAITVVLSDY